MWATASPTERTLVGPVGSPNAAGTVVVGLGCETVRSDVVAAAIEERGLPVRELTVQDARGADACVDRGMAAVADLWESVAAQGTDGVTVTAGEQMMALGDLAVGVVADDPADSTRRYVGRLLGVAGRPAGAMHIGTEAAVRGSDVATGLLGSAPVMRAVAYGQRVDETDAVDATTGMITLLDMPPWIEEVVTDLAAAGAHLILHITGRGTSAGHPIAPVVELSGGADTLATAPDDVDLDARKTDADDLEAYLSTIADGDRTCAK